MTLNADNVRTAVTGAAYTGNVGAVDPGDATTAFTSAWKDLGYLSDDGIKETPDEDTKDIKSWQNSVVVRKVVTKSDVSYEFTLIESTAVAVGVYHKQAAPTGGTLEVRPGGVDRRAFAFDVIDGDEHLRIVIPNGEVTKRGAISYKADDAISYQVTVTAYPDTAGVVAYKYNAAWV